MVNLWFDTEEELSEYEMEENIIRVLDILNENKIIKNTTGSIGWLTFEHYYKELSKIHVHTCAGFFYGGAKCIIRINFPEEFLNYTEEEIIEEKYRVFQEG